MSNIIYDHEITFCKNISSQVPFISKFFGETQTLKSKFIIIEFIEGETLLDFVTNNKKKLDYFEKIIMILEMLIAVEYIHVSGFILRDLKYDNIMIDSEGNAVLIDFDETKQIGTNDEMIGDIRSPIFSSPEQYSYDRYSQETDVYSLGIIIHFILTEAPYTFNAAKVFVFFFFFKLFWVFF